MDGTAASMGGIARDWASYAGFIEPFSALEPWSSCGAVVGVQKWVQQAVLGKGEN